MSGMPRVENKLPPDDQKLLPEQLGELPAPVYHATRLQRFALIIGLLIALWLALQLFASVLAPFVAAAVIAYALDPPTTQLTRLGIRRSGAALIMVVALIASALICALLLYPLVIGQIGLLVNRIPQYATLACVFAAIDFAVMLGYAGFGAQAAKFLRSSAAVWLDRICGGVLLALAGTMALYRRASN